MKKMRILPCLAIVSLLLPAAAQAEEGAAGHYMPGMAATFIDALPGKPAVVVANAFTYYDGKAPSGQPLEFGGLVALDSHATAYADSLFGVYQTPLKLLGGNYAAAVTIPYVWMDVKGQVQAGPVTRSVHDSANGVGDITLYPFMLGWTNVPDLKYDVRMGIYAPTGPYDVGHLANTGRNYWTFEPSASLSWLSSKIGTEISIFTGLDFNTKNNETDYRSGASFHLEGTLAQHLPLFGGFVGAGASAFYYQQISADSGSGAKLGDFEGHTAGVGPVVSYAHKVGNADLAAEVKWLPELDVEKRTKGDYVWVKVGVVF
jgi:hypothetical protein